MEKFTLLKKIGLGDSQAKVISNESEFFKKYHALIMDCLPGGPNKNGAGYLWTTYQGWKNGSNRKKLKAQPPKINTVTNHDMAMALSLI